jgi:mRNA (guanine-N7-)-methyltransferase
MLQDDVRQIVSHYNNSQNFGRKQHERDEIRVSLLLKFNNCIKCLSYHYIASLSTTPLRTILDICCGKGGDLNKFLYLDDENEKRSVPQPHYYYGVDVSSRSIEEAQKRWRSLREKMISKDSSSKNFNFHPFFLVADAHLSLLPSPAQKYDLVSIQFALHYAFESEQRLDGLLSNITRYLVRGGFVVMTFLNENMGKKFAQKGGSSVCSIKPVEYRNWDIQTTGNVYNRPYTFYLEDCIQNCIEYFVDSDTLIKKCEQVGLQLHYYSNFKVFYNNQKEQRSKYQYLIPRFLPSCSNLHQFPDYISEIIDLYQIAIFQFTCKEENSESKV